MRKIFGAQRTARAVRAWSPLTVAAGLLWCASAQATTIALDRPDAVLGAWDLSLAGGNKECRLTLRAEPVHGGQFVAMPLGCRHALPILNTIGAWVLPGDNHLDLADAYGKSVLDFTIETEETLVASGPEGEIYRLTLAAGGVAPQRTVAATVPSASAAAPAKLAANAAHPIVRPGDVAGRYSVLREEARDTGCMLTLDDQAKTKAGNKAFLSPACRDQGIVIFDPTAWQIVSGRLVLTARKGHSTHLDLQPDGVWLKDPKEGSSLSLKKM
ncbi:MAG: AprI/Inh family metalloprotease inhibitor [Methylocella sp.]